ncbi:MAG: glycosyltransferase family 4 protein [Candidatus Glassbacteria bacterium]
MIDSNLQVVMLTGAYFPEVSGAGLQCRSLIAACSESRIEFTVITTNRDPKAAFRDTVDGVPVYRIRTGTHGTLATLLVRLPQIACLWFKVIRKTDVLHLHGFSRKSWLFILLGRLAGARLLLKLTSLGEDDPASVASRGPLARFFYNRVDRYVAPSEALCRAYLEAGFPERKLVAVPNGVDTVRFFPADAEEKAVLRDQLGLPRDRLLILFVGHHSRQKSSELLVRVWKELDLQGTGMVLIGTLDPANYEVDREVVSYIRQAAASPDRPGPLILVERTGRIEDYYRACDLFVLSSVREGMPNALVEAMACGLACIATRLAGITDRIITDGDDGLLFAADDRQALGELLTRLAGDGRLRLRLGARARETAVDRFDMRKIAASYGKIYRELAGR